MELLLLNMQKHRNFRIDSNRLIILLDSSKEKGGMNKLIIIEIWICTSYISRIEFVGKINYDRTINGQVSFVCIWRQKKNNFKSFDNKCYYIEI